MSTRGTDYSYNELERGDHISWKAPNEQRRFGKVVRRTTSEFQPAFVVENHSGTKSMIVPARYICREVG